MAGASHVQRSAEESKRGSSTAERQAGSSSATQQAPRSMSTRMMDYMRRRLGARHSEGADRVQLESVAAPPPVPGRPRGKKKKKGKKARFRRRIDTNVVSITLENLADDVRVATGEGSRTSDARVWG